MIKKRLIELLKDAKKYIYFNILYKWLSLISQIIFIFVISNLISNTYYQKEQNYLSSLLILVGCLIVRYIFDRLSIRSSMQASSDVKRILRTKIYDKLLNIGSSYSDYVSSAEINQVTTEGVEQLETYFGSYLPQLFYSLLAPITLFIVLSFINLKASIVLLICVPLIPISIVIVQKIAKRLLNKYWDIYTGLADSFLENLQGLTTLKIYQADQMKADQMDKEAENFRKITMKVLTMQLNSTSVMDIVAYGGAAIGIVFAINEFVHSNVDLVGTLRIILLASEFFIPLRLLGSFFHIAMNGMAASDKIFKILDLKEPEQGTEYLNDDDYQISIKHLDFAYDESRKILKDVNMEIYPHSFVSIVGTSGCGKSTIASLIQGKHHSYEGIIKIQNKDLHDINEKDLLSHVILVKHNSYLFKGTIRDNLMMASDDLTDEDMIAALKKVNLWSFLKTMQGLDTELNERSSNLSGGQKQRLSIARALLKKNGDVYIFDEATSNIDIESEDIIMKIIHELAKEKTIIFISHRLANVVDSDYIYMMQDGAIVEQGTHESLMHEHGSYQKLFDKQKELETFSKKGEIQYA